MFVFASDTWNGFLSLFVWSDGLLAKGTITLEGPNLENSGRALKTRVTFKPTLEQFAHGVNA